MIVFFVPHAISIWCELRRSAKEKYNTIKMQLANSYFHTGIVYFTGKPLLTLKSDNRPSLGRAHSMKSAPRTPLPQDLVETSNDAVKFGTVRHISSIIGQSLAHPSQPLINSVQHSRSRSALNGRPTAPPPSVCIFKFTNKISCYVLLLSHYIIQNYMDSF